MDNGRVSLFVSSLKRSPQRKGVFNPWWEVDQSNDAMDRAPEIRRRQLFRYLQERQGSARFVLVGEALGYQGGKFSGIPMTSERILLGGKKNQGIFPNHVFNGLEARRTSRERLKKEGFSEPTATIVWGEIVKSGLSPHQFALWNAFPWHPYDPKAGPLSNRTPDSEEFEEGHEALTRLIYILDKRGVIMALGEKAAEALRKVGIEARKLRHPSQGGARRFREEFKAVLEANR
jgi:uracil-DNA glycosylase